MKKLLIALCAIMALLCQLITYSSETPTNQDKGANIIRLIKTGKCYRCNLSGLDLRRIIESLNENNIPIYLKQADLSNTNLAHVDLSGALLREANFSNANVTGANLSGAHMPRSNLSRTNLSDANLENALCQGAIFNRTILTGAQLKNTHLHKAELSHIDPSIDLSNANFNPTPDANEQDSKEENLQQFAETGQCHKCDLSNLDLRETIQSLNQRGIPIYLKQANLSGCTMSNLDLSGVHFRKARVIGADLTGANLLNANLPSTDLTNVNLTNANLTGAILRNAIVTGALFTNANLTNANIKKVDFSTAGDITNTKGLEK